MIFPERGSGGMSVDFSGLRLSTAAEWGWLDHQTPPKATFIDDSHRNPTPLEAGTSSLRWFKQPPVEVWSIWIPVFIRYHWMGKLCILHSVNWLIHRLFDVAADPRGAWFTPILPPSFFSCTFSCRLFCSIFFFPLLHSRCLHDSPSPLPEIII